jgi:hypothetical protein
MFSPFCIFDAFLEKSDASNTIQSILVWNLFLPSYTTYVPIFNFQPLIFTHVRIVKKYN